MKRKYLIATVVLLAAPLWMVAIAIYVPDRATHRAEVTSAQPEQLSVQHTTATLASDDAPPSSDLNPVLRSGADKVVSRPVDEIGRKTGISQQPKLPKAERQRQMLEREVEWFFSNHSELSQSRKIADAKKLLERLRWAEEQEYLLPVEGFQLRVGLIDAVYENPRVKAAKTASILSAHRQRAEDSRAAVPPDPRTARYRSQERLIVKNTMESQDFSSEVERMSALRERLVTLRKEVYSQSK